MRAGVIGLGDMGSGIAKNLMANGFETWGLDLDPARQSAFAEAGGQTAADVAEVGRNADAVFVMVMNGDQAKSVIYDGLMPHMAKGGAVILSATIKPREARRDWRGHGRVWPAPDRYACVRRVPGRAGRHVDDDGGGPGCGSGPVRPGDGGGQRQYSPRRHKNPAMAKPSKPVCNH